jgi:hypothetical protein
MDSSQRYFYFFSPTFAQSWWTHSRHSMHWTISQISSNLRLAKPARLQCFLCSQACSPQFHLKFHFTSALCDVSWWDCSSGRLLVHIPFRQIFLQRSCKELSNLDLSIFFFFFFFLSFFLLEFEVFAFWLFVIEFVVPGLITDKNLASMPRSHCLQICLYQLAKRSGESSYSVGYTCRMSVEFYKKFTYLNLCYFSHRVLPHPVVAHLFEIRGKRFKTVHIQPL